VSLSPCAKNSGTFVKTSIDVDVGSPLRRLALPSPPFRISASETGAWERLKKKTHIQPESPFQTREAGPFPATPCRPPPVGIPRRDALRDGGSEIHDYRRKAGVRVRRGGRQLNGSMSPILLYQTREAAPFPAPPCRPPPVGTLHRNALRSGGSEKGHRLRSGVFYIVLPVQATDRRLRRATFPKAYTSDLADVLALPASLSGNVDLCSKRPPRSPLSGRSTPRLECTLPEDGASGVRLRRCRSAERSARSPPRQSGRPRHGARWPAGGRRRRSGRSRGNPRR